MRPTARQRVSLAACVDGHRELYNAALQERRDAWRASRTRIGYGDQSAQLKDIRRERPDVAVWSFSSQQATLRRLNRAFDGFFRRVKAHPRPGYPRFKGKARFDSVEWPKDCDGARRHPDTKRVYLQGIGQVKVTAHRAVLGRDKTIQLRRQGRHWMLILSCDDVPATPLPATGREAGVDVGIASSATTSDGDHIHNPRWARTAAARLAAAQQRLADATRGANNRGLRRETVAARYRKVANQRKDFHPAPDPQRPGQFLPNGAAAKTGLNRSISDAGWGQFVSMLGGKAEDAGRTVIEVDPRHTSNRCEACGHAAKENRVTQAVFACRRCGHTAQADEHAARNILRVGLAHHTAQVA